MRTLCLLFCAILVTSCSKESLTNQEQDSTITQIQFDSQNCQDEQPKTRLTNNGTVTHSVRVFDMQGNSLVSEFFVNPGEVSEWFSFEAQEVLFAVDSDSSFLDEKVILQMDNCTVFDMEVGADDALVSQELSNN